MATIAEKLRALGFVDKDHDVNVHAVLDYAARLREESLRMAEKNEALKALLRRTQFETQKTLWGTLELLRDIEETLK